MKRSGTLATVLLVLGVMRVFSASPDLRPFSAVTLERDSVVVTFPKTGGRYLIKLNSNEERISEYGEAFQLGEGSLMELIDKHIKYEVRPRLTPPAGIEVNEEFDARSFGGKITKDSYFVPAIAPGPAERDGQGTLTFIGDKVVFESKEGKQEYKAELGVGIQGLKIIAYEKKTACKNDEDKDVSEITVLMSDGQKVTMIASLPLEVNRVTDSSGTRWELQL